MDEEAKPLPEHTADATEVKLARELEELEGRGASAVDIDAKRRELQAATAARYKRERVEA